jgi:hypothetical protein
MSVLCHSRVDWAGRKRACFETFAVEVGSLDSEGCQGGIPCNNNMHGTVGLILIARGLRESCIFKGWRRKDREGDGVC